MENPVNYQNWEPVVLKKSNNKNINFHHQNAEGTKQLKILLEDDIPKLQKFSVEQLNYIKDLRRLKNISQKDLAKKCNINASEINRLELGQMPLNMKFYNNLIRSLNSIKQSP
jgi:ribosome-binding protein aMBF1 (putative translation factor)